MKENILKHLRAPEGVDEEKWKNELSYYLDNYDSWLYWPLEYEDLNHKDAHKSFEDLCDRCEALERENARLREELAKSRLTWSDEEPTEEGWYWVESTTGVSRMMEYFLGIYATGIYSITACTPDGKPRRNCRIPEPQEPSE